MVKAFHNHLTCCLASRMSLKHALLLFIFGLVGFSAALSQNSSNKGTDFWVGFMNHRDGQSAGMYLYITSDSNTSGKVEIPGENWSTTFNVTANQMTLVQVPTNKAYVSCSDCVQDRGIHVTSQKKIVVYSHIYHQYASDATLVLPTPTTGKKYYAMSFEQNRTDARSQFMIIANQDDTKVRITPSIDINGQSGTRQADKSYEIKLDAGEVYQARAQSAGTTEDVTGSFIEVIDTGASASCKTVSVFSGSSDNYILCSGAGWGGLNSRDNLYQQLYPVRSWGTEYITIPFKGRDIDHVKILASEDQTTVIINKETGAPTVKTLNAGEAYTEYDVNKTLYILAGKPVSVAQFQVSQKCGGKGDPSMTILSPIQQTLKDIAVYSSEYEDIDDHYINIIIPNAGINSFRLDGSTASFTKVKKNQAYSYAQVKVGKGNHRMTADVGFLAIAYGFGNYESYGYSAGANIKDLTAQIDFTNSAQAGTGINSICLGDAAKFDGKAEYKVSKWIWDYGDGTRDTAQNVTHVYQDTGDYVVTLYTYKVLFDGCSTYDSTILEMRVNGKPVADFGTSLRCEKNLVNFYDSSKANGPNNILVRQWIFHDNSTVYASTSKYTYDTSGDFDVTYVVRSSVQCFDTMKRTITINPLPDVSFIGDTVCFYDSVQFTNTSSVRVGGIDSFTWYFGDGDSSYIQSPSHYYQDSGFYYVNLIAKTDSGCVGSYTDTVQKYARYVLDFNYADTCASLGVDFTNTSFTDASSLNSWNWKFPGGTTYNTKDVNHQFVTPGLYDVTLIARWDTLCLDSITHQVQVDPNAVADFSISSSCLVDTIRFINTSTITGGTITGLSWDLDDGFTGTSDTMDVKYTSKGSKDIKLIVQTDQGCQDTATINIDLVDPRITSFNIPNICENLEGIITANVSLDGDNITSWNWDADGTTSTTDTLKFTSSATGRYGVRLDLVTGNNCKISYDDTLDVYATPVADFTIDPVCFGEDLVPVNNSSIQAGESIASYNWYVNNSFETSGMNPTLTSGVIGTNIIRLIATSRQGCNDAHVVDVDIYPLPNPSFIIADSCLNETTRFSATSTISSGSISTNQWTYNDGTTDNGSSITRFYPAIGEYSVTLVSTSAFGCVDSTSKSFNIHPLPQLSVTLDPSTGCQPLLVTFTNTSTIASGTIDSYEYDFGDGSTGASATTTHNYPNVGTYTIRMKGTSNIGCVDSIVVSPDIVVQAKPTAAFSWNPFEPSLLYPDIDFINESSADATSFEWTISNGMTFSDPNPSTQLEPGDYTAQLIAIATNGCRDTISADIYVKLDFFVHAPTAFSPNGDLVNDQFGIDGMIDEVEGYSLEIFNMWGELVFSSDKPTEKWDGTYKGKEIYTGSFPYVCRFRHYETQRWVTLNGVVHIIK